MSVQQVTDREVGEQVAVHHQQGMLWQQAQLGQQAECPTGAERTVGLLPDVVDPAAEAGPVAEVLLDQMTEIVDGQQAVLFLVKVKELMEDPAMMLVD